MTTNVQDAPELTGRSEIVWRCIARFIDRHGYAPTMREIARLVGTSSTSAVLYNVEQLEAAGILTRAPKRARSIVLLEWPEVM